jgi:hypothetical protein
LQAEFAGFCAIPEVLRLWRRLRSCALRFGHRGKSSQGVGLLGPHFDLDATTIWRQRSSNARAW